MLYTGKGDGGTSKLFNTPQGERIPKDDTVFEVLGSLDRLNSSLGMCRAKTDNTMKIGNSTEGIKEIVLGLQQDIFIIQAEIAGAEKHISEEKIIHLEKLTNDAEKELPPITTFFIPGETELGALYDIARTSARDTERIIVKFRNEGKDVSAHVLSYLNRLSSVLYAFARLSNHFSGINEIPPTYQ